MDTATNLFKQWAEEAIASTEVFIFIIKGIQKLVSAQLSSCDLQIGKDGPYKVNGTLANHVFSSIYISQ